MFAKENHTEGKLACDEKGPFLKLKCTWYVGDNSKIGLGRIITNKDGL